MSTHIRESIMQNILTAVQGITVAAGYNNTVTAERWKRQGNPLAAVPYVVVYAGPEDKSPGPDPQTTCEFTVILDVWMQLDDDSATLPDAALSSLILDIEKAVMADHTRGGYAEDTQIINNVPFESVEGHSYFGTIITLQITYKHKTTDPALYV